MAHGGGDFERGQNEGGPARSREDILRRAADARRVLLAQADTRVATVTDARSFESRETGPERPAWNEHIMLTFDDSLRNVPDIIDYLERHGIDRFRFYGEAFTAMRPQALAEMGVVNIRRSTKITPGRWLTEYVDPRRGSLTREQFMRQYMIKKSPADGTNYLETGRAVRDWFIARYPTNWLEKLEETFGYHAAILHPNPTDERNHIQYWTPDQIREDIETFETFMRAWLNITEFHVRHLRTPCGGGFGYDAQFNTRWWTGTKHAQKLIDTVAAFRPGATWDMWTTDSLDAVRRGKINYRGVARSAVDSIDEPSTNRYAPRENLLLLHSNYYDRTNLGKLDPLNQALSEAFAERYFPEQEQGIQKAGIITVDGAWVRSAPETGRVISTMPRNTKVFVRERVGHSPWLKITWGKSEATVGFIHESQLTIEEPTPPEQIPSFETIRSELEEIEPQHRHYFTPQDRAFIQSTIDGYAEKMDWSSDQYFVVVNRESQFGALVFYSRQSQQYYVVGNFGTKTSTGKQDVPNRTWATPLGMYDLKPLEDKRRGEGKPEWRTEGKGGGGFGPAGSRVFHLGKVDVKSPYGKPLSVALHKTSRNAQRLLGQTAASHGCIRVADAFIDILDRNALIDGRHGRYVLVGDSSTTRYAGDDQQLSVQPS